MPSVEGGMVDSGGVRYVASGVNLLVHAVERSELGDERSLVVASALCGHHIIRIAWSMLGDYDVNSPSSAAICPGCAARLSSSASSE